MELDIDLSGLKQLKESYEKAGYVWDDTANMAEHRWVATQVLGRPLQTWEHVHHINRKKNDNDPANLMVLSEGIHALLHSAEVNYHFAAAWGDMKNLKDLRAFMDQTHVPYIYLADSKSPKETYNG